jgi:hypothetical protein
MKLERLAHPAGVAAEAVQAASLTINRPRPATTGAAMTTTAQLDGAGGTVTAMDYNAILDDEPNLDRPTVWR